MPKSYIAVTSRYFDEKYPLKIRRVSRPTAQYPPGMLMDHFTLRGFSLTGRPSGVCRRRELSGVR